MPSTLLKRAINIGRARHCPVCGSNVRHFLPARRGRADARCPVCRSFERHRVVWLYLQRHTDLFTRPTRLLHIAPEPAFAERLARVSTIDYVTADLAAGGRLRMDVTRVPFRDDSFDAIYCSHVLEHVSDDVAAMREFRRVLRDDGWAILQVPLEAETTVEDPTATTPEARQLAYGKANHVRMYGGDYPERLREAGFHVTIDRFAANLPKHEYERMALGDEPIFLCRKGP